LSILVEQHVELVVSIGLSFPHVIAQSASAYAVAKSTLSQQLAPFVDTLLAAAHVHVVFAAFIVYPVPHVTLVQSASVYVAAPSILAQHLSAFGVDAILGDAHVHPFESAFLV